MSNKDEALSILNRLGLRIVAKSDDRGDEIGRQGPVPLDYWYEIGNAEGQTLFGVGASFNSEVALYDWVVSHQNILEEFARS